jgi:hypothetical protein
MQNKGSFLAGLGLIMLGGLFLAQQLDYIGQLSALTAVWLFGAASLFCFAAYFIAGVRQWGWLFPAGIFGGLAASSYLSTITTSPILGAPVLAGVAAPFVVAFVLETRKNVWALIPASVMLFITLSTALVDRARGEFIGAALFFILALAFLVTWAVRREWHWALLVAYVLGALGLMPLMASTDRAELAGVLILFAIALPFFVVYFNAPDRHWWAIMPAGILATIGATLAIFLSIGLSSENETTNTLGNALIFTGTAGTFAVIWLRHQRQWAMWATGLSVVTVGAALLLGPRFQDFWPVLPILIGLLLVINTRRPKAIH